MNDSYDIFISYARENMGWVQDHLHEPLLACRTGAGARPRIFLDVSDEGIPPGWNYQDVLASALQRSRYILPVYSKTYFTKPMCSWELSLACQLDPSGSGRVVPVLMEPEAAADVPFKLSLHQYLDSAVPDWFERLIRGLQLTVDASPPLLAFQDGPRETIVNHTLLEVRVAFLDHATQAVLASDDPIAIRAEGAELQGTLIVTAEAGVATFRDLAFATSAPAVRLVAEAPGCAPVASEPLVVLDPPSGQVDGMRRLAAQGDILLFFGDSRTVAVVGEGGLSVFSPAGGRIAQAELGRIRLVARGEHCVAFADWAGRVVLAHRDGRLRTTDFAGDGRVLSIPGGLCFAGERAYVGFWDGAVWALSLDGAEPERVFDHPAGVQGLAVTDEYWAIAGLDGQLVVRMPDGSRRAHAAEPVLLGLAGRADAAVVVGEEAAYRIGLASGTIVREPLPLGGVGSVFTGSEPAVAVGADGRGVRLDGELTLRGPFHTTRGARVIDADRTGRTVAFAYPDGSHAVMLGERVVFSTTSGAVAVAPDGSRIAFADGESIVISPAADAFAGASVSEAA